MEGRRAGRGHEHDSRLHALHPPLLPLSTLYSLLSASTFRSLFEPTQAYTSHYEPKRAHDTRAHAIPQEPTPSQLQAFFPAYSLPFTFCSLPSILYSPLSLGLCTLPLLYTLYSLLFTLLVILLLYSLVCSLPSTPYSAGYSLPPALHSDNTLYFPLTPVLSLLYQSLSTATRTSPCEPARANDLTRADARPLQARSEPTRAHTT